MNAAAAVSRTRGFEGVIHGATLSDLIQMECLSMNTRAVRVDRSNSFGRIYFAGGQIVHAETGDLRGETALFALISWPDGQFSIEEGVRSMDETITRDWHSLLLEAAQLADENGWSFPSAHTHSSPPAPAMPLFNPAFVRDVITDPEMIGAVQFTEDGTLLESAAENAEDLQAAFAYITQLTRLIGESLGAENLHEMQITGTSYKALCAIKDEQTVAGITTAKANVANLLKKLG